MVSQGERPRRMPNRSVLQKMLPAAWESMCSTGEREAGGLCATNRAVVAVRGWKEGVLVNCVGICLNRNRCTGVIWSHCVERSTAK